ncbi:MAG TPA: hypothetical protein ENI86_00860 [Acidimicrobiales bacterium]|nr:hypothetical protein [Acidimicrobiales bacterium]
MNRSLRILVLLLTAATMLLVRSAPAGAQSVDDTVQSLNRTGVYVEPGADADAEALARVADRQSTAGGRFYIVVLAEDPLDTTQEFTDAVLDELGSGTVITVAPNGLAAASNRFSNVELGQALDASGLSSVDTDLAVGFEAFARALGGSPTVTTAGALTTVPDSTSTAASDASSGGSAAGLLIFLLVVVVAIVVIVMLVRRSNRRKLSRRMDTQQEAVAKELSAIGEDIVEFSDAVQLADNPEITEHYRTANSEFLELQEKLAAAENPWAIEEVDQAADITAWHLDAVEALLDGRPAPPRPEKVEIPTTPPPATAPARPAPRPGRRVDTRTTRRRADPMPRVPRPRSSGGSGMGGVLGSILTGTVLSGGGSRRRSGRSSRSSGSGRSRTRSAPSTATRRGSASRSRGSSRGRASRRRG